MDVILVENECVYKTGSAVRYALRSTSLHSTYNLSGNKKSLIFVPIILL